MFLGALISFIVFGGLAFITGKLSFNLGIDRDNRFLALLFYFLGPLFTLTIVSCLVVGLFSVFGLSFAAAGEALAHHLQAGSNGGLMVLGSILTAVFAIAAIATGPATAFTASQASIVVAILMLFITRDRELCKKWLPWVAFATYGFCMWPFAAIFTFGL